MVYFGGVSYTIPPFFEGFRQSAACRALRVPLFAWKLIKLGPSESLLENEGEFRDSPHVIPCSLGGLSAGDSLAGDLSARHPELIE
jgi:hypothetical protein